MPPSDYMAYFAKFLLDFGNYCSVFGKFSVVFSTFSVIISYHNPIKHRWPFGVAVTRWS